MASSQQTSNSRSFRRPVVVAGVLVLLLILLFVLLTHRRASAPAPSKIQNGPTVCGQRYREVKSGVLSKIDKTAKVVQVTDITDEDFGSPGYFYYSTDPLVFDGQCASVSFESLKPDQHLTVYYTDSKHFFIQTN